MILLLVGAAAAQPEVACPAPLEAAPPLIDGRLDEEVWDHAPAQVIDGKDHIHPLYRAAWTGPADLSGRVRALRIGEHLFLALEITDDTTLHARGRAWWAGDSIEVFFDTDRQSEEDDSRFSSDDFQLFLMPFYAGQRWGVVARGPDAPYPDGGLRGIELAHRRHEGGYTVEARIPLFNLEPLRPDPQGRIGFDIALNDVDDPASASAETYMTLSGRFDLYSTPSNFADLRIGERPAVAPAPGSAGPAVDWSGLFLGLIAVALLAFAVRGAARSMAKRARVKTATLCGLLAAAAALCSFLPTLATLLDDRATRLYWDASLQQAAAAAATHLDLDTGDAEARSERLVALLRDGRVRIRPHYRFGFVPLRAAEAVPGRVHYGIRLGPGEVRRFPLEGRRAPARLRLDLQVPEPDERGAAGAEVSLVFDEGPPLVVEAPRRPIAPVLIDTAERAGDPMRLLEVRNRLLSGVLVVDACFGEAEDRAWQPLPLAFVARAGVPLDVWHGRPATHILPVPRGGRATVRPVAVAGHRLWLAVGADGAYPATPYGVDVATIRVVYAQGPGPELRLVNGRDLESRLLSYGRIARAPDSVALHWEDSVRRPELFTLHSLELDPTRPIERLEIEDLGVLGHLSVAAVTVGHRIAEAPPRSSGLRLDGDLLRIRDEVREAWSHLGFLVRSPAGTTRSVGAPHDVRARYALPFGEDERGTLEVRMPHHSAWAEVARRRSLAFGAAALLLTFAAVVAGAALLYRARHLRVKMLAALAAATVAPLLFLVVSLTQVLNDSAESDLQETTLTELHRAAERLAAAKARARELAAGVRDTLELVPAEDPEVLRQHLDRSRAEIEAQGAFLHLPDLEAQGRSGLGNGSFFDALSRPGLYYSPWDGLVALGLARTAAQRRCLVGLPAPRLLGAPQEGVTAVLYGPRGEPLAATGGVTRELERPAALTRQRERLDRLTRTGEALYEARTPLRGGEVAAAHALVRDGGKVVGLLGVYRSRAATEGRKAAYLRTLLLSTLAALLLVVLAGGTLVERVTVRLRRVTNAAREIARGRLDSRAPVESEDEVGRLAASFNTMAEALDDRVRQLTDLQRGLQELTVALDRHAVAQAAADLLARATDARRVEIVAREPATDRLESLHRRWDGEGAPLGPRLPASGPARDAVEAQRPLTREGALFLPLLAADRAVGLAICAPFTREPETFLDVAARQIGIALENARLYHAAVTDELTGLYSRPFFVRRLKEEVDRAAATDRPLSLLRIVIADYGAIARRQGAAAAVKVTAESAAVIERVLPRRNILACGEPGELLALLVESDAAGARAHLDAIGAALQSHEFETRPTFTYRSVTYPRDGAAADILLDSLFEAVETWEQAAEATGPLLKVPPDLEFVSSRSPTMRAALEVVARVAPTNATVLLAGETGTGKEVLADLIQANSNRRDRPYVKVNCAAIPETLVETELFGHERGAFTGADRRRIGRFERAHRGTLFLDEVGDLPLPTQVKLLRTLQERRIHRVGSSQPLDVDVRILAATNRDLGAAVRRGTFREDLYHRVHVIELRVPPLRERREDIPDLINGFRTELNLRHGLRIEAFAPDALDALYRHTWPGNVRELKNIVERSMLLSGGPVVERAHLALPDEEPAADGTPVRIEGLTPRQERVLQSARERGGVTNGEIVEAEGISARTALRELQKLVDRGLLVRVGRRRGAVYRPT